MASEGSFTPRNLLVLAEDFYPNVSGGAHARWRFCQISAKKGHRITVFTPLVDEAPRRETLCGVDIVRPFKAMPSGVPAYASIARFTRAIFSILLFFYLIRWMRNEPIDGIHSASASMHWVGKVTSIIYGVPLVTFIGYTPSVSRDHAWSFQMVRERVNFRLFMGDVVFCRLEQVKSVISEIMGNSVNTVDGILHEPRVRAAAENVNRSNIRGRFGLRHSESLLIFVGRLVPVKNCIGALQVLSGLPDTYHLVIVGDGPERNKVEQEVRMGGLVRRVTFTGELAHEETLKCIAAADALVMTSHEESYGGVALEALALETPVFATPVGVLPAIDHDRLAIGSIEELPELVRETSAESNIGVDESVLSKYSMERYTETILSTFEELIARRPMSDRDTPRARTRS